MKEYIYNTTDLKEAHIVDEELLQCLQKALQDENETAKIGIKVNCSDGVRYDFSDTDELVEFAGNKLLDIDSLNLNYESRCENSSSTDSIEIIFQNEKHRSFFESSCDIKYQFHDGKSYYFIKNKIETVIRNKKPGYSILTRLPLTCLLVLAIFVGICVYTAMNHIIFPDIVAYTIFFACWVVCLISMASFAGSAKRVLFPKSNFRFGLLKVRSDKVAAVRSYIWKGVIMTVVLAVFANFVSQYFLGL